eukprot:TRINITY_DN7987_c0_g1_i1.p2 TRINITY_DN7987_c0_g1~~TRINITY_DN7987_c0_g1_i1.p2  ORF type:complete len:279 (+),score=56.07 TRINITY_DN7987_c0_g1_i1:189-1025(+)
MSLRLGSLASGEKVHVLPSQQWHQWALAWSDDGRRLATVGNQVNVYQIPELTLLTTIVLDTHEHFCARWLSQDRLALGSRGSTATFRIVDVGTHETVFSAGTAEVRCMSFSSRTPHVAVGTQTGNVQLIELSGAGRVAGSADVGADHVHDIAFSPSCALIAAAAGRSVHILSGLSLLRTIALHNNTVWCVRWLREGVVLSGGQDHTLRATDTGTGAELAVRQLPSTVYSISLLPVPSEIPPLRAWCTDQIARRLRAGDVLDNKRIPGHIRDELMLLWR